ncbi:MAG: hypothetical protein WC859_08315 [Elusimicrobiota bacterium]|jgi:hypothetical protein
MKSLEQLAREQKLAELAIARQCLEDKDRKIWELQKKVELLENLLNRASASQGRLPQPQPFQEIRQLPKRWGVR